MSVESGGPTDLNKRNYNPAVVYCRYLLPQYSATVREMKAKIENIYAARGQPMDLKGKKLEDLVDIELTSTSMCQDPHMFSPVTVGRDEDLVDCSESFYTNSMLRQYHITATLQNRTLSRRAFAAKTRDTATIARIYASTFRDVSMMLDAPPIKGCPPVYNDLKGVSDSLLEFMYATGGSIEDRMARKYFLEPPPNIKDAYRGCSAMITRLAIGARNNLGLQAHQQAVWLLLYLRYAGSREMDCQD